MPATHSALTERIRELEQQVTELSEHKRQLELVIAATGVGIWDWHVQTGATVFNERWANILGYTLAELSPVSIETWLELAHPDDLQNSERHLKEHWAGKSEYYACEARMRHKDGHWVWVYDTGKVIEWESEGVPRRMIGTHLDVTEQKQVQQALDSANRKLRTLSLVDPLTNIPNRRAYDERLEQELGAASRSREPLTLMMIDIDYFKDYNDNYGHENGDLALRQVARAITKSLPRKTDFVARYGGEEFVVLLPYTTACNAEVVADGIMKQVRMAGIEHAFSAASDHLSVSVGIASTEDGHEGLLLKADQALYQAKKNGRNRYVVDD